MSKHENLRPTSLDSITIFVATSGPCGRATFRVTNDKKLALTQVEIVNGATGPTVSDMVLVLDQLGIQPCEVRAAIPDTGRPRDRYASEYAALFYPTVNCKQREAESLLSQWLGWVVTKS